MAITSDVTLGESGGIHVVDFGPFLDGTRKQAVADAVVKSFKQVGFVYLVNYGISQEKVDEIFTWVRKLNLPHVTTSNITNGLHTVETVLRFTDGKEDASTPSRGRQICARYE